MSVKLIYKDIAVGSQEDAEVTASDTVYSTLSLLPYGSGNGKQYATLEHNAWVLDGSRSIVDGGPVSFWSSDVSDENCEFVANPTITISFDNRYTSLGVFIAFKVFPAAEIKLTWYQSNAVLDAKTFYPDNINFFCENTVEAYDKVTVEIVKTWLPFSRVQIDNIIMGIVRTFTRQDFRSGSARLVQEIDITSREMAANVLDFTLSSHENVEYLFQLKQPVEAYDNTTLMGTFYINGSNRRSGNIYDVQCTDAIGVLGDENFPEARYLNKNAYELAVEICAPFAVEMDDALKAKTVSGILKSKTRRTALQQLCFAIGAVADTSGTDKVRIFQLPEVEKVIPPSRTRIGGSIKTAPIVTEVRLTSHSYSTSGSGQEVTVAGVKYYDTTAVTSIVNPNVTASDKQNVVSIDDATLISPDNVAEIAQRLYNAVILRDTYQGKFRVDGEKVGDKVVITSPWGTDLTGTYSRSTVVISGITVSDAEVIGL